MLVERGQRASHSNLHLFRLTGSGFLHEALDAFMDDPGHSNTAVGHRQLILSPSGGPFAFGATSNAMALWVVGPYPTDGHDGAPEYLAWPPDGYFPIELATARWSLSHTSFLTADLSSASVSMTFEEEPVDIIVHHSPGNYGRMPTVTWDVTDHRFDDWLSRGRDISFDVTVTGIEVDGVTTSRSYTVTMVGAAEHAEPPDHDWFVDDNGSIFQPDIRVARDPGITNGCDRTGTRYCPNNPVTRRQMAAFLRRGIIQADRSARSERGRTGQRAAAPSHEPERAGHAINSRASLARRWTSGQCLPNDRTCAAWR